MRVTKADDAVRLLQTSPDGSVLLAVTEGGRIVVMPGAAVQGDSVEERSVRITKETYRLVECTPNPITSHAHNTQHARHLYPRPPCPRPLPQ